MPVKQARHCPQLVSSNFRPTPFNNPSTLKKESVLQHADKPIVITGSQIPITFQKTDAKKNITDAIRFACEGVGGVYVVFDGRVIQGTRAIKLRTKSYDAFE